MSKLKRTTDVKEAMRALGFGSTKNPIGLGNLRHIAEGPRKAHEDILSGVRQPKPKYRKPTA